MAESKDLLPPRPLPPQPSDCCGTGCLPCVHDIYEQDIKAWKVACDLAKCSSNKPSNDGDERKLLRKDVFTEFEIISIDKLSEDTFMYKFRLPDEAGLNLQVGQHLILKQTVNNRSLTRQYTPVSPLDASGYFDILIKIYPKGKMTQVIKNWNVSDKIPWRGPFGTFTYVANHYKHLLMLAAGTGIAPLYQIITHVLSSEDDETRLTLYYCSRSFKDILLRQELLELTSYWNFNMIHYLSNESSNSSKKYNETVVLQRLQKVEVKQKISDIMSSSVCSVLICGTKSFEKDMVNACKDANLLDENIIRF